MKNIISLFFTAEFSSNYEPTHLLLAAGIGIVAIMILIKKIVSRRTKKII